MMEIYQHFRNEEKPFIDQVLSWKEEVMDMYKRRLTDFLNPREQHIVHSIIGKPEDLVIESFGGNEEVERKRIILAPFYEEVTESDFNLTLLEATYPNKFVTLEHRDVLGAFMSLGIKREKLGDLIVTDKKIQIIVSSDISSYVMMNLTGIKKAGVQFEERPIHTLLKKQEEWHETTGTVSSLRLDTVVKEIYNFSRQKASLHIEKGLVKVNFRTVEDTSFLLQEGDMISIRGKGRSQLVSIEGQTKRDKWRITTALLK